MSKPILPYISGKANSAIRITPYKRFYGSLTPNWLMRRPEVSQGAKLCYGRLCQCASKKDHARIRQDALAFELGVTEGQARRYLHELKKYNLIEIQAHGWTATNRYYFLKHDWMEEIPEPSEPPSNPPGTPPPPQQSDRDAPTNPACTPEENTLREKENVVNVRGAEHPILDSLQGEGARAQELVEEMVRQFDDPRSQRCYHRVVKALGCDLAYRLMLNVFEVEHRIRGSIGAYFIGAAKNVARTQGINLGFRRCKQFSPALA